MFDCKSLLFFFFFVFFLLFFSLSHLRPHRMSALAFTNIVTVTHKIISNQQKDHAPSTPPNVTSTLMTTVMVLFLPLPLPLSHILS